MKHKLTLAAALLCAAAANADEIYTYQGNALDTGGAVSGSFTLPDALPGLLDNSQITPQDFSFTWNGYKFNESNTKLAQFFIATNEDGSIATWNITLVRGAAVLLTEYYGSAFEATDAVLTGHALALEEGNRGSWTFADPPAATPEPSTLAFLFVGLLAILRRR